MVASCLLEALLMFPQKLESRIGHQRWPYLRVILSFSTISLILVQCASGAIHGGLMFTRSITNASTKVRKQRYKGKINWPPEEAIFASNSELVFQLHL